MRAMRTRLLRSADLVQHLQWPVTSISKRSIGLRGGVSQIISLPGFFSEPCIPLSEVQILSQFISISSSQVNSGAGLHNGPNLPQFVVEVFKGHRTISKRKLREFQRRRELCIGMKTKCFYEFSSFCLALQSVFLLRDHALGAHSQGL